MATKPYSFGSKSISVTIFSDPEYWKGKKGLSEGLEGSKVRERIAIKMIHRDTSGSATFVPPKQEDKNLGKLNCPPRSSIIFDFLLFLKFYIFIFEIILLLKILYYILSILQKIVIFAFLNISYNIFNIL